MWPKFLSWWMGKGLIYLRFLLKFLTTQLSSAALTASKGHGPANIAVMWSIFFGTVIRPVVKWSLIYSSFITFCLSPLKTQDTQNSADQDFKCTKGHAWVKVAMGMAQAEPRWDTAVIALYRTTGAGKTPLLLSECFYSSVRGLISGILCVQFSL